MRRLWYARGRIAYRRDRILPDGRAVLLVNLGAAHATASAAQPDRPQALREAWVCGLQTRALVNEPLGEAHMVGASFATAGAATFFGPPMSELGDRVAPLAALWGRGTRELRQEILDAPSPEEKLACLEHGLLTRLRPAQRGLARPGRRARLDHRGLVAAPSPRALLPAGRHDRHLRLQL